MKITTAEEMRAIDRASSERFGVPSLTLMENAGTAVAEFAVGHWPQARRIAIVCGKGNNGGDGFVAARKLREAGRNARVLLLAEGSELKGDAAVMFGRMGMPHEEILSIEQFRAAAEGDCAGAELIIDALLGTGVHPPVTGFYAETTAVMNASPLPILAVDIPSGADADAFAPDAHPKARADAIVTFTAPRPAHVFGQLTRGPLRVAPIGSPDEAIVSGLNLEVIAPRDIAALFPPRVLDANKGRYGHVLTVGGSVGKSGAAAMAGLSVLRVGAGLSTVATAKSALPMVANVSPELMTEALAETDAGTIALDALEYNRLDLIAQGKTVLALGPGISRNPDTAQFVRAVTGRYDMPVVLDADGLNAFEGRADKLTGKGRALVLTPHPGEMSRLVSMTVPEIQRDRVGVARAFAAKHRVIVVLKGYRTVITFPDGSAWINATGNPGMATGGTGDVLTGMIAGIIAQHPDDVARSVLAGVYLHGLAGDVAGERTGEYALIATDLINAAPEAIARLQQWGAEKLQRIQ